jgi:hypothetical protein
MDVYSYLPCLDNSMDGVLMAISKKGAWLFFKLLCTTTTNRVRVVVVSNRFFQPIDPYETVDI